MARAHTTTSTIRYLPRSSAQGLVVSFVFWFLDVFVCVFMCVLVILRLLGQKFSSGLEPTVALCTREVSNLGRGARVDSYPLS